MVDDFLIVEFLRVVLLLFVHIEIRTIEIEQAMWKFVARQCPYSQETCPLIEKSHSRHAATDFCTWSTLLLQVRNSRLVHSFKRFHFTYLSRSIFRSLLMFPFNLAIDLIFIFLAIINMKLVCIFATLFVSKFQLNQASSVLVVTLYWDRVWRALNNMLS